FGGRSGRHALALGLARRDRAHGHKVRMRHRPVRGMHGPPGRQGRPFLCAAGRHGRRPVGYHHRRRKRDAEREKGAERVARRGRRAMRILSIRPDHVGRRPDRADRESHRRRHQRGHVRQHLPLRDVRAHPRRHQAGGLRQSGRATNNSRGCHVNAPAVDLQRRRALKLGGLSLAFVWLGAGGRARAFINARPQSGDAAAASADGNPAFAPNAFIRVEAEGPVRLVMPNVEMGQGIYTGACTMLAEELGVGMDQIKVEHAPPNLELYAIPLLGEQATGGSTSTRDQWAVLREAGAVARTMLVTAAASRWRVDPASCTVERAVVVHAASGRKLAFGALAKAAGALPIPPKVALKDPAAFTLIGKPLRRIDSPDKVVGATQFGIDAKVPGMKIATVKACPTRGGKLVSVDDARARAVAGFVEVVKIGNAVAVVGDHFWAAKQGLDALGIQWDLGENAQLTTAKLTEALAERSRTGATIIGRQQGKKPDEGKTVEALYQLPLLAHAPMEPLNATVQVTPDRCEIWVGTQVPVRCVSVAAKITGLPESKVIVHNHYIGGGFGRRLETDSVEQAVLFAKQVKYPLKVVWTREEDIRHDLVRPMYYDRISA